MTELVQYRMLYVFALQGKEREIRSTISIKIKDILLLLLLPLAVVHRNRLHRIDFHSEASHLCVTQDVATTSTHLLDV